MCHNMGWVNNILKNKWIQELETKACAPFAETILEKSDDQNPRRMILTLNTLRDLEEIQSEFPSNPEKAKIFGHDFEHKIELKSSEIVLKSLYEDLRIHSHNCWK